MAAPMIDPPSDPIHMAVPPNENITALPTAKPMSPTAAVPRRDTLSENLDPTYTPSPPQVLVSSRNAMIPVALKPRAALR